MLFKRVKARSPALKMKTKRTSDPPKVLHPHSPSKVYSSFASDLQFWFSVSASFFSSFWILRLYLRVILAPHHPLSFTKASTLSFSEGLDTHLCGGSTLSAVLWLLLCFGIPFACFLRFWWELLGEKKSWRELYETLVHSALTDVSVVCSSVDFVEC